MNAEKDAVIHAARRLCDGTGTLADLESALLDLPVHVLTWEITWADLLDVIPEDRHADVNSISWKHSLLENIASDLSNLCDGFTTDDEHDVFIINVDAAFATANLPPMEE